MSLSILVSSAISADISADKIVADQIDIYKKIESIETVMTMYVGTHEEVEEFKKTEVLSPKFKPNYQVKYWASKNGEKYRLENYIANPQKKENPFELRTLTIFRSGHLERFYASNSEIRINWEPPKEYVRDLHRMDGLDQAIFKPFAYFGWDVPMMTDTGHGLALWELQQEGFLQRQLTKLGATAVVVDDTNAYVNVPFELVFPNLDGTQRIQKNDTFRINYEKIDGKWMARLYAGQFGYEMGRYAKYKSAQDTSQTFMLPAYMTTATKVYITESVKINAPIADNLYVHDYDSARKIFDYTANLEVDPAALPEK